MGGAGGVALFNEGHGIGRETWLAIMSETGRDVVFGSSMDDVPKEQLSLIAGDWWSCVQKTGFHFIVEALPVGSFEVGEGFPGAGGVSGGGGR